MVRSLLAEREGEKQRAQEQTRRAEVLQRRADDLHLELLRAQLELERYKKWYYGPRADRLQGTGDLAQLLLIFAEEMDRKAVHPEDASSPSEPQEELRRVNGARAGEIWPTSKIFPSPHRFTN